MNNIEWYYVNLAHRTDRDETTRSQFATHGIAAKRFEAFTPDEWPGDPAKVAVMGSTGIPGVGGGTPGAIGCQQSQLHVMRMVQGTDRVVGICEDDVCFCEDFNARLDLVRAFCESHEWDIFWLGGTFHIPPVWHKDDEIGKDVEPTDDPRVLRTFGIWSTYAYLVNGRSVRRILEICDEHIHESVGIDYLAIKWLEPELKTFCFVPGCVKQFDGLSNIGNGITTFSHFANLGPHWYADRMEDFDPLTLDWTNNG